MAPRNPEKLAKKQGYMDKLKNLIQTVPNALIVHADNVGAWNLQSYWTRQSYMGTYSRIGLSQAIWELTVVLD